MVLPLWFRCIGPAMGARVAFALIEIAPYVWAHPDEER
jgi:hypothetical protein